MRILRIVKWYIILQTLKVYQLMTKNQKERKKKVSHSKRKTLKIYSSGRSTDFIAPSITIGCQYDCSYCYLKRHHPDKSVDVSSNINDILYSINSHVYFDGLLLAKPNQTDDKYITYDIGCNADIGLDSKYWDCLKDFNNKSQVLLV